MEDTDWKPRRAAKGLKRLVHGPCNPLLRYAALMASASSSLENSRRVLVTGAGGRTGKLVFEKLQAKPGRC